MASLPPVKQHVVSQVQEQAEAMLGMSMTFTLFEWVKENVTDLMEQQTLAPVMAEVTEEVEELSITQDGPGRKEKREQLSKQQKRRAWDRAQAGGAGERARGWDWVDIIRHLSQTAPS
ncbi:RWD domain-containing protein 4-like [Pollicipes pollicipes]|uniref:RWD domain-containing protein 4-like n=1 Tax=Pollicipes pollicipes TaxID=41117 RepID=UPI001884ECC7|nr:RWD domain-containing protein 4-like [Pollicipes pollicipes]